MDIVGIGKCAAMQHVYFWTVSQLSSHGNFPELPGKKLQEGIPTRFGTKVCKVAQVPKEDCQVKVAEMDLEATPRKK